LFFFFFFNDTATTEIYTLSLHDALPILSDVYGGGFIVEGDQITGKFGKCRIKAKKDDGKTINLIAACASDIMLSSVQFSLKEVDASSVIRLFPGMDGMEIKYARCSLP